MGKRLDAATRAPSNAPGHQQPLHAELPEPRKSGRVAGDLDRAAPARSGDPQRAEGVFRIVTILFAIILAQTRIASDFELQQMQRQVETSRDFVSQLSGHLNIGDLRMARNETALARAEYAKALDITSNERSAARRASDLTRYATATSYAALAEAKLGD